MKRTLALQDPSTVDVVDCAEIFVASEILRAGNADVGALFAVRATDVPGLAARWLKEPKRRGFDPRGDEFVRFCCERLIGRAFSSWPRTGIRAARVAFSARVQLDTIFGLVR
jgi:hypothetical protein